MLLPTAQLLAWDISSVWVRCPYCDEEEIQNPGEIYTAKCNAGRYICDVDSTVCWTIDKTAARYLTPAGEPKDPATDSKTVLTRSPFHTFEIGNDRQVLQVAQSIRHRLAPGESHLVKQLVTRFLDKHIWFPHEVQLDKQLKKDIEQANMRYWWLRSSSDVIQEFEKLEPDKERAAELRKHPNIKKFENQRSQLEQKQNELARQQRLVDLARIAPGNSWKTAEILTDGYQACGDCRRFVERVNEVYGVSIKLINV